MSNTKKIVEYGVVDFCRSVQEAFEEGYRIDLTKNETCPMVFGTMYELLMVKPDQAQAAVEPAVESVVVAEVVPTIVVVEPESLPTFSEPAVSVEQSAVVTATRRARKQSSE